MKKELIGKAMAIGLLLAGIIVIVMMLCDDRYEQTDDAQVEQYISPVNVKVAGYIRGIRFTEHQHVHKGDTLLIIDDREYAIALQQAEASLMDAHSGRKVAGSSVNTASSNANVYDSSIEEAELRVEKLQRDYDRYAKLLEKKASTPVMVEQYKTELDMAKARVSALKRQREAARSSVSEVSQRQENAEAAILRAEAAVDMARLNLSYTVVTAPADGCVGRRTIEEGQLVSPGQTITTLIPDTRKWVIANFKETQMSRSFFSSIGMCLFPPFMVRFLQARRIRRTYLWCFLLTMIFNSANQFVATFAKLSTPINNLQSASLSEWAIAGCLFGLLLSIVLVAKKVHFRTIFCTSFLLMAAANAWLYFQYQPEGLFGNMYLPTVLSITVQATIVAMKEITGETVLLLLATAGMVLLLPYHKGETT